MDLVKLKTKIESFSKERQKEILNIFIENDIDISENSNGCFINLSMTPSSVIKKITDYLKLIEKQEEELLKIEELKKGYINQYFKNNNKEDTRRIIT